jgi:hypothetical protein
LPRGELNNLGSLIDTMITFGVDVWKSCRALPACRFVTQHPDVLDVLWFSLLCIGILLVPGWVLGTLGATRYGVAFAGYGSGPAATEIPMSALGKRDVVRQEKKTPCSAGVKLISLQKRSPMGYSVGVVAVEPDVCEQALDLMVTAQVSRNRADGNVGPSAAEWQFLSLSDEGGNPLFHGS